MTTAFRNGASDIGIILNGVERVTIDDTGITSGIADLSITPAKLSQKLTRGTAVVLSSTGTTFTGIPSWAKKITVMLNGVSTNGVANVVLQIGSGSLDTSGYTGGVARFNASTLGSNAITNGFGYSIGSATDAYSGIITITNISGNIWVASGSLGIATGGSLAASLGGTKTLSGVLDRVGIVTTDTFDAGSINIMWE